MSTIAAPPSMIQRTVVPTRVESVIPPMPHAAVSTVTPEVVRIRAYELYLARSHNGSQGNQESDWLQAERELNGSAQEPLSMTTHRFKFADITKAFKMMQTKEDA